MRRVLVTTTAAALLLLGGGVVRAAPSVVASRVPVTITASSLDVGRLVYVGTTSVQTSAGAVDALELHVDQATFHGLALDLPCVPTQFGGLTGRTSTEGTATSPALTVYATDVVATIDGTRVRLSSTDPDYPPPPAGTTLVSGGTLAEPRLVSLLTTSGSLEATGTRTSASFCSPAGAGAGVTGGVPFTMTTPTPSPAEQPTPTSEPTTGPTAEPTTEAPSPTPTEPTPSASPTEPSPTPTEPVASPDP
jgi:hypothetical protein